MSTIVPVQLTAGATFANGVDGLHAVSFNWAEALTIKHLDSRAYGVTRFIVTDRYGRHGYAY